ncbi:MAG: FtsX-like permease family protein [Bacilli bacterium]
MYLLFINALKGLKKKKVQMLGIIFLVFLSTAIYTAMNSSIDRLEDRYYAYLEEQNVEDISFGVTINFLEDITKEDLTYIKNSYELTEEETQVLNSYETILTEKGEINTNLNVELTAIFKKYDIDNYIKIKILDSFKDTYDFSYELELSKLSNIDNISMKVILYDFEGTINNPYLVEGRMPEADNEITILPKFGELNNIKVGDDYTIGETTYKVVGYAYASDYIYPIVSMSNPFFNERKNNIIFMTKNNYNEFNGIDSDTYAFKFNNTPRSFIFDFIEYDENNNIHKLANEQNETITTNINTFTRITRISQIQLEFDGNRTFAKYFLYLLLSISVFIILIVTKKRIDDEKLQIGVLKSLGYNRYSIAFSYLVYPIVGSIIGGILGYILGIFLQFPLTDLYRSYYTLPLDNFSVNLSYLKTCLLTPLITLSILSYLIALFMLRKKTLNLLREGSNLKVSLFSRIINKLTKFLPFDYRFKYSLASRSLGKLIIVTLTSFCTGMLIVLTLIGMNLFNDVIEKSFQGFEYDYLVSTSTIQFDNTITDDKVLSYSNDLFKVIDKDGNELELEDDYSISLMGIDVDSKYVNIIDKDETNIKDL